MNLEVLYTAEGKFVGTETGCISLTHVYIVGNMHLLPQVLPRGYLSRKKSIAAINDQTTEKYPKSAIDPLV